MCPMCGGTVSASATECPGCGEPFTPIANGEAGPASPEPVGADYVSEETVTEVTEEYAVAESQPGTGRCVSCDSQLRPDGTCPTCSEEKRAETSSGCPMCGNPEYSVESGNLVSCMECGNVYVRPQYEEKPQNWKWKFWVGLVFILFGNVFVALGSYVHNVARWSPLGSMYLGYGWMDQMVGIIGIVVFILGLILFAWSFKREREVTCPSCNVTVRESDLTVYVESEEVTLPDSDAVESALVEIGDTAECPTCGATVSMFDTSCANCGEVFDLNIQEPPAEPEEPAAKEAEPGKLLKGSEINQDEIIMESLELEGPENGVNGDLEALSELESAFDEPPQRVQAGTTCSTCGARVGLGLDTCPGCGASIPVKRKKGGE